MQEERIMFPERVLSMGLVMVSIIVILVLVGFKFAPFSTVHLRYVLYQGIVYPLVAGVGMIYLGYSIHHKYRQIGNFLMKIGLVIAILMFSVLASLGGWFLFIVFCSMMFRLLAFVLAIGSVFAVFFLLAQGVKRIVHEFRKYNFATRQLLILAWTFTFIVPLVSISIDMHH